MKKDNAFKQAARWVARMFGYKAESRFGRAMWYVFFTSAAIVTFVIVFGHITRAIRSVKEYRDDRRYERMMNSPTYLHDYENKYVSPYVIYHDDYPSSGYLYNTTLGRRTETGIQWICRSSDGDSLACYCKNDKRGYFNRFTGKLVVPPQYEKAWIFSEGLACVMENGMLHFIDHKGQKAIDKEYPYANYLYDYCFHNGLCEMLGDGGRIGLIDKQGNWVVEPVYSDMTYYSKGFWVVNDSDNNQGLLDANGQVLLPIEYDYISVRESDSCIFVHRFDYIEQVLDFNCNVINPCNIESVYYLEYTTDEYDEEGEIKKAVANCKTYRTYNTFGLMDKNGKVITAPVYLNIKAIGPDRYHCWGSDGSVILDSKGNVIEQNVEDIQTQTK
jgi:hypothetical protein